MAGQPPVGGADGAGGTDAALATMQKTFSDAAAAQSKITAASVKGNTMIAAYKAKPNI